ncbi:MAG: DNA polymerase IV [Myxococcota bacterium]|nr:DNA polymerase IV [Myxococcota bacterium]
MTRHASDDATPWERIILHADMDAFFAAVEQLDNPELRGKPVLVGGAVKRGVVSTASYEARPYGVGSAMPMATALRRCPHAIVVPPRFERYSELSQRIMAVFRTLSPLVEPLSLDEAFLDMTGSQRLLGTPLAMAERLKRDVYQTTGGLTVSVGVATTKYVAKVASDMDKPDGLTLVAPDRVCDFLWPLEIRCLWGVGPKTQQQLIKMGLKTIGDVAKTNESFLLRKLGTIGSQIAALAHGRDLREVEPIRKAKSIGAEVTLADDITGEVPVRNHLRPLAFRIAERLRHKGLAAMGVRVKLKTAEFQIQTRQRSVSPPVDTARYIEEAAVSLLSEFDLSKPMRLVGLAAFDLKRSDERAQMELFPDARAVRQKKLEQTLDAIKDRFGPGVIRIRDDGD